MTFSFATSNFQHSECVYQLPGVFTSYNVTMFTSYNVTMPLFILLPQAFQPMTGSTLQLLLPRLFSLQPIAGRGYREPGAAVGHVIIGSALVNERQQQTKTNSTKKWLKVSKD